MNNLTGPTCFLFDNGSFRPESTLALRRVAERLQGLVHLPVRAVSLLHSHKICPIRIQGIPAQLLEESLAAYAARGGTHAVALPLFFGPSGAMQDYLPPRIEALSQRFESCHIDLASSLEDPADDSAEILASAIKREAKHTIRTAKFERPSIIVTDHGSPLPVVAAVRDRVGRKLAEISDADWATVSISSMERREGPEYAFNDPLLENALREAATSGAKEIVVALQFLFPGRHAGPGGDIAEICESFSRDYPTVRVKITNPIGESDEVLHLLKRRVDETLNRLS